MGSLKLFAVNSGSLKYRIRYALLSMACVMDALVFFLSLSLIVSRFEIKYILWTEK